MRSLSVALLISMSAGCGTSRPPAPETPLPPADSAAPPVEVQNAFARELSSFPEHRAGDTRTRMLVGPEGLTSDKVAIAAVTLEAGLRLGPVTHPCYDMTLVVLAGELTAATGASTQPEPLRLGSGDAFFVPAGRLIDLTVGDQAASFLQVFAAQEGIAACEVRVEAGATAPSGGPARQHRRARLVEVEPLSVAGGAISIRMLVDPERDGSPFMYVGQFAGRAGLEVPPHRHPGSDEVLVIANGEGTLKVGDETIPVHAGMIVRIPADTEHSFSSSSAVEAIQIYAPAGPEARFRTPPPQN